MFHVFVYGKTQMLNLMWIISQHPMYHSETSNPRNLLKRGKEYMCLFHYVRKHLNAAIAMYIVHFSQVYSWRLDCRARSEGYIERSRSHRWGRHADRQAYGCSTKGRSNSFPSSSEFLLLQSDTCIPVTNEGGFPSWRLVLAEIFWKGQNNNPYTAIYTDHVCSRRMEKPCCPTAACLIGCIPA